MTKKRRLRNLIWTVEEEIAMVRDHSYQLEADVKKRLEQLECPHANKKFCDFTDMSPELWNTDKGYYTILCMDCGKTLFRTEDYQEWLDRQIYQKGIELKHLRKKRDGDG